MNRRQHVPDVDEAVRQNQIAGRSGAGRGSGPLRPPPPHGRVGVRNHRAEVCLGAPAPLDLRRDRASLLHRRAPRIVAVGISALRIRPVEHKPRAPLGVGGCEQARHRPSLGIAEQRGTLRADGVHDSAHVVHSRLQIGKSSGPVGEPRSSLVEANQPRERRESAEKMRRASLVPVVLEMRNEPRHQHQVARPVADNLIGDIHPPALRVPSLRMHQPTITRALSTPASTACQPVGPTGSRRPRRSAGMCRAVARRLVCAPCWRRSDRSRGAPTRSTTRSFQFLRSPP